jgi:hypothetical protein
MSELNAGAVVAYLNDLHAADPAAAHCLFEMRLPVSERLCGFGPLVARPFGPACEQATFGLLGVLNGLLMRAGDPERVVASYDEHGELLGFSVGQPREGLPAQEEAHV